MLYKKGESPNYHSHMINAIYIKRYLDICDSKVLCHFIIIVGAFLKAKIFPTGTLGNMLYFKLCLTQPRLVRVSIS